MDGSGDQITSFGGGTQYAVDAELGSTPTGTLALGIRDDALSSLTPVEGDAIGLRVDANGALWVIPSGTVTVDLGANNDVTVTSGAITATLSAVDNAVLDTIDAVLDTINAKLVTGTDIGDVTINNSTGGSAVNIQDGGNTITVDGTVTATPSGVQEIEGDEAEGSAALPQPILIGGDDGTDVKNINVDATTGDVQVDVTNTVTVDLGVNNDVSLNAGTNAIGKLAANSGVDIGDVDILSIAAGDNNIGNVDIVSGTITTVSTLSAITGLTMSNAAAQVTGDEAHDATDAGNPVKIGGKAKSPDGTDPGSVAENDRTDAYYDLNGRQFVNNEHPRWVSYHLNTSTAQTDTAVFADPGDGFQIVITYIQFSLGAATAINMFLEEGASTIWGPIYLEAVNGRGYVTPAGFNKHVTASTALTLTTSASVAHSVDILGYIQAV